MLAPVAPHITEELWQILGKPYSIHTQKWPAVDEDAAKDLEITLSCRSMAKCVTASNCRPASTRRFPRTNPGFTGGPKYLEEKSPRQIIYVTEKLINIVL